MTLLGTFASDVTPPVGHPLCAGWYPPAREIGCCIPRSFVWKFPE